MTVVNTPLLLSHAARVEYMALIEDKISEIRDPALRASLLAEVKKLKSEKKFGLVFEEHIPELAAIYAAPIRPQATVARKTGNLNETYFVERVEGDTATVIKDANGAKETLPLADLVVIKRFGEPIYPALMPVAKVERGGGAPYHTLIEADNYHALQLLEYAYAGQVDVIYIDPPYNTGARDWKYNNNYVDLNDQWRHSKWLSFMQKRLLLARRLLKPDTGVLIVTIDEHEVHHLGTLLETIFPDAYRQTVTIVVNPKGVTQGRFSRVEEYAIFIFMKDATAVGRGDDLLTPGFDKTAKNDRPRWKGLLRSGTNARREDRKGLFFPVLVDPKRSAVLSAGDPLPYEQTPDFETPINGLVPAWPIRSDNSLGNWGVGPTTLKQLIRKGYVALGGYDSTRRTYGISYLSKKLQDQIDAGFVEIVNYDEERNVVDVRYVATAERQIKTVWHRTSHDAGAYGSDILKAIFGKTGVFSFPKSIYAVKDALNAVVRNHPNALILDFFAGSGTTLHATCLLNAEDGGRRHCILITNNEVSDEEARNLIAQGYQIGHPKWEARGICRSVTFPRCKYVISGQRDNGTALEGEYLTGRVITKEKPHIFRQLSFVDPASLTNAARKREITSLIGAIPQAMIEAETAFFVSEDERHTASILFDEYQAEAYLAALDGQEHITHFYIVTRSSRFFSQIKAQISDLLGPLQVQEEEKRPMREGFAANLEYFKLEFLDPNEVALGEQFATILPVLWLRAGAKGPRPCATSSEPYLIPADCSFAVLLEESYFKEFQTAIAPRTDLTHIFLVTDSEAAFFEMKAELDTPQVIMLYKDYLENFKINVQRV
jgi:adenine-specific DNA-methyltransferase